MYSRPSISFVACVLHPPLQIPNQTNAKSAMTRGTSVGIHVGGLVDCHE